MLKVFLILAGLKAIEVGLVILERYS